MTSPPSLIPPFSSPCSPPSLSSFPFLLSPRLGDNKKGGEEKNKMYLLCGSFKCDEDYLHLGLYPTLDEAVFNYLRFYGTNGENLNTYTDQGWVYAKTAAAFHCLYIQPISVGTVDKMIPYTIYTFIETQKLLVRATISARFIPCINDIKNGDCGDAELDFDFFYPLNEGMSQFRFY